MLIMLPLSEEQIVRGPVREEGIIITLGLGGVNDGQGLIVLWFQIRTLFKNWADYVPLTFSSSGMTLLKLPNSSRLR